MASTEEPTFFKTTLTELDNNTASFTSGTEYRVMTHNDWGFKIVHQKFADVVLPVPMYFLITPAANSLTIQIFNEAEFKQSEFFDIENINDLYI